MTNPLCPKTERERDEARAELVKLWDVHTRLAARCSEAERERDALRIELGATKERLWLTAEAAQELVDAATSITFPDGDHGAEQSALASALRKTRAALKT